MSLTTLCWWWAEEITSNSSSRTRCFPFDLSPTHCIYKRILTKLHIQARSTNPQRINDNYTQCTPSFSLPLRACYQRRSSRGTRLSHAVTYETPFPWSFYGLVNHTRSATFNCTVLFWFVFLQLVRIGLSYKNNCRKWIVVRPKFFSTVQWFLGAHTFFSGVYTTLNYSRRKLLPIVGDWQSSTQF